MKHTAGAVGLVQLAGGLDNLPLHQGQADPIDFLVLS
jgi:hypothetical protein